MPRRAMTRPPGMVIMCAMDTNNISVVFLDAATLDRGDMSFGRFPSGWDCTFHDTTSPAQLLERLAGRQVAVTNKVVLDAAAMASAQAADLKLIAIAATGVNNVDLDAAKARGLAVCNVAGYSTQAVVQHTFGFILEFTANVGRYARDVAAGAWQDSPIFCMLTRPCLELEGKVLGIVGLGQIGRAVADAAPAFGLEVLISQRPGQKGPPPQGRTPLEDVLRRADFLCLHCPLTPDTEGLIGVRELDMMKPGAFLINVARGGIVDEAALIAALRSGRIAGAGFDVLTQEAPPPDHPMIRAAAELDNLLLTPHTAWSAKEARQRLLDEIAENIKAFLSGRDRNRLA